MVEELVLFAISALFGLGCVGAAAWVALNPETLDVDKISSILVCLLLGLTFLGLAAWMLFHTKLREMWKPAGNAPGPQDAGAKKQEAVPQGAGKSVS